jgi:hypothetical protein
MVGNRTNADREAFELAHADYLDATAQDPNEKEDRDARKIYGSLQSVIQARAVTIEQVIRKIEILKQLQRVTNNPDTPEPLLLASIKQDLEAFL